MYVYRIEPDAHLKLNAGTAITPSVLDKLIGKHRALIENRYKLLRNAYRGIYPILSFSPKEAYKPDNRLVVNFAKYIVDTFNGFFIGNPIKITSDEPEIAEFVNDLDLLNDQDSNNAELSRLTSIYGKAYEVYYVDEKGDLRITYISPMDGFMVYDQTIEENPICFISLYKDTDNITHGEIRDRTMVTEFSMDGGIHFGESYPHGFDGVPVTEYMENDERIGIFEPVYSLINAYNKVASEKANDIDYFADAYMKVLGAELSDEELHKIRDNRIINFAGYDSENLTVDFMGKPDSDATQENFMNRLERLIFQISMVANISDENFGSASGIALRYKLAAMQNLARTKERKFVSGMNRRYKLIFSNPISGMKEDHWMNIRTQFSLNYPVNVESEVNCAKNVDGIVSKETQLSLLSFVDDVQVELDRMEKEQEDQATKAANGLGYFDDHDHSHEEPEPESEQADYAD